MNSVTQGRSLPASKAPSSTCSPPGRLSPPLRQRPPRPPPLVAQGQPLFSFRPGARHRARSRKPVANQNLAPTASVARSGRGGCRSLAARAPPEKRGDAALEGVGGGRRCPSGRRNCIA